MRSIRRAVLVRDMIRTLTRTLCSLQRLDHTVCGDLKPRRSACDGVGVGVSLGQLTLHEPMHAVAAQEHPIRVRLGLPHDVV